MKGAPPMKAIVPTVSRDEARQAFLDLNNNRRRVREVLSMCRFHRPFWLVRLEYAGLERFTPVTGSVVAIADARIFRLGIVGAWKRSIADHLDLSANGVDFRVVEADLGGEEPEEPLIDRDKLLREINGIGVRKIMSKGLAIRAVDFTDVRTELVYRPYWEIRYVAGTVVERAFMSADALLLRKTI